MMEGPFQHFDRKIVFCLALSLFAELPWHQLAGSLVVDSECDGEFYIAAIAIVKKHDASGFQVRPQCMIEQYEDSVYPLAELGVVVHGVVDEKVAIANRISLEHLK